MALFSTLIRTFTFFGVQSVGKSFMKISYTFKNRNHINANRIDYSFHDTLNFSID